MTGILITAAGKRLGKAMALHLARQDYYIYLHYHSGREEAEDTLTEIQAHGGEGEILQADLSDFAAAENLVRQCNNPAHPLRHIINNASRFVADEADNFTEESFAAHMAVNLRAPLQLGRALHALVPDGAPASVVNIIDSKVFALNADYFSYSLSKVGLNAATEMMAQAFGPKIRVNGIAPGLTLIAEGQSEENFALASRLNFTGQPLNVQDIARTAHLLITSPSINASVIPVDGGQKMINLTADVVHVAEEILKEK